MKPVRVIIAGLGGRGRGFARYIAKHPDEARLVGVAEPIDGRREPRAAAHAIPRENVFTDWADMAARPRFADAVIIATQDAMHVEPVAAFAALGYHILLEKPMAPNEADCRRIVETVKAHDLIFGVCHVLRYTRYTRRFKALIDSGAIGEVVGMQHLEPVGYWHQAHSFVRGPWRNEAESSFMLLAKSCHDIDWIRHIMGVPCRSVSSFGSLKHFRKEERPEGAAERCVDCPVEPTCCYSAKKIYFGRFDRGHTGWPVASLVDGEITRENLTEAVRTGPYGRCVYACDNDVVDHQVVNMLFEGERTATFTMTAFNKHEGRKTRVFGTKGELCGDASLIHHFDFLTDETTVIDTKIPDGTASGGHGGGDEGVTEAFLAAVATGDRSRILTGPDETLESHLMVFAAERARRENRVVSLQEPRT